MLLKITTEKSAAKHSFPDGMTWGAFRGKLAEITGIEAAELEVLHGFPPALLKSTDPSATVESLGVKSGSTLLVRPNQQAKDLFQTLCHTMGFPADIVTRVITEFEVNNLELAVDLCQQLSEDSSNTPLEVATTENIARKVIPADNSCLFNSVGYLLQDTNNKQLPPLHYRGIVADTIRNDPSTYNKEFLEKDPAEYVRWILSPDQWGGEIELSILSSKLEIQISVADIRSSTILTYGENTGFIKRIFLLYDGVHYDALVKQRKRGSTIVEETRTFLPDDEDTYQLVLSLAGELQQQKKFVNLATGQIYCNICFQTFAGEKQAVEHAKKTGHQNFAQSS